MSQQARVISTQCEIMCFLFHCAACVFMCVCVSVCVSIRCSTESEHLGLVGEEAKEYWGRCWHFEEVYFWMVDVICPKVETRLTLRIS